MLSVSTKSLFALAATLACTVSDGTDRRDGSITLIEMPLPALGNDGSELRRSAIAVSESGYLAFSGAYHEGPELITITDSTGRVIARAGREGGGPGELRSASQLLFEDSTLYVTDAFEGRLTLFNLHGGSEGTVTFGQVLTPIGHTRDSVDFTDHRRATGPRVLRRALHAEGGYRTLIPRGDSVFDRLVTHSRSNPMAYWVGIGSTERGALVGDGIRYELFAYEGSEVRRFGRYLPVRPPVDTSSDTLSYFGLYSFGLDEAYRVWVVGTDDSGGFVDAFEGSVLVHHEVMNCRPNRMHGMSVAGRWLAVLCLAPEQAPVEVTLRLFRIVG